MKYETPQAFREALDTRLRRAAGQHGVSVVRLRKRVVYDRLIARLNVIAPDRWVVKGGVALELRFGDRVRPTQDLDLIGRDGGKEAEADLIAPKNATLAIIFRS